MNFEASLIQCIKTNDPKGIEALGLTSANVDDIIVHKFEVPNKELLNGVLIPRYPTPLVYAILCRKLDVVIKLIELKAKIDLEVNGWKPIHYAVATNQPSIVRYIIEYDTEQLEATTNLGTTLLHLAVSTNSLELVDYLLISGANPNSQNLVGNSTFHFAALLHQPNIIRTLLAFSADPEIKNNAGVTPIDIANSKQNSLFLEIIKETPLDLEVIMKEYHQILANKEEEAKIEPAADPGAVEERIKSLSKRIADIERAVNKE
ncbi:ankyrin repeat protein, putative [Trichomonas vaginalis G3]|uniref:Ankyrin repeat protein, putative n=1 Tax=Trichomonas vaginalis (strain ATCC PRA-98 / G3) TaxID=412133 RepID=A2G035_TRIV3|nr:spectrin binding [Trichomonas vaginalis G3]EAX89479.1 ankyrin repeat protein, putative [Trichomonas vaginalis G3]KAI5543521.1 spectrin binding [Trichomonas vaginalis G3]|eukprot:XP_001302409.1 ankyrin repeat protein [Trichomonas vaginalis G3]